MRLVEDVLISNIVLSEIHIDIGLIINN